MGTRHRQRVINKNGEVKINQYGQWDGYPAGQGVSILEFLIHMNFSKYQKQLDRINQITPKQVEKVNQDPNWEINYPYLSRDCGADIHELIQSGQVKFVSFIDEDEAKKWCEGFYTIDFNKMEFITEFHETKVTYDLNNLPPKEEYLSKFIDN